MDLLAVLKWIVVGVVGIEAAGMLGVIFLYLKFKGSANEVFLLFATVTIFVCMGYFCAVVGACVVKAVTLCLF